MERFCIRAADGVFGPSRRLISDLGPEFADLDVDLIKYPFDPTNAELPSESDAGICYFGRVQVKKGILEFAEAYSNLVEHGLREPAIIVGGDTQYTQRGCMMTEYLQRRYKRLIDDGLMQFHGLLPLPQARDVMKTAKVVVIPSIFENFAYSAIEVMAQQRVLVTSSANSSGHAEVMTEGETGLIFEHSIPGDLERQLERGCNLSLGDRRRVGQAAREVILRVSDPTTVMAEKNEFARKVIARHLSSTERHKFPFIRVSPVVESAQPTPSECRRPGMLTVVIPYFNMGRYLNEALQSALESDYPNREILVLNAASTDAASVAEFYRLQAKYEALSDVRFEHVRDRGLADTRNRGAELAQGEFITFLDPDDLVFPNYYSVAIGILKQYENVGLVGCWCKYFEASDGQWLSWNTEPPWILFHNCLNTAGAVYRRSAFIACGGNDPRMIFGYEDYECMVRMVAHGFGGVAIPQFLFWYRARADSMTQKWIPENVLTSHEHVTRNNPVLFQKYAAEIVNLLNNLGPGYRHDNPLVPPAP
jgi:glycosyltransferase involved in cell wall biosynthesis